MRNLTPEDRILAARRLSRTKIFCSDDLMSLDVVWCRTAYSGNENWTNRQHCHTFFELQFPMEGENIFKVDGSEELLIRAGEFLMIPPQTVHQILYVSDDFAKFVFGFNITIHDNHSNSGYFREVFESIDPTKIYSATSQMTDIVEMLLVSALEQRPGYMTAVTRLLELMLCEIAGQILPSFSGHFYRKKEFSDDMCMDSINQFIEENISGKITSETIAQLMHMSTKQLNRITKKSTGRNIGELIQMKRLEKIKTFLETTDFSLQQISEECGYSNEFNLIRFFKSAEGLTPGKYRESLKM